MITFRVDDMTCGHCVSTITRAVAATAADAKVTADLARHLVTIEASEGEAQALAEAIAEAGYTPVPVAAGASSREGAKAGGCGCGGGGGCS